MSLAKRAGPAEPVVLEHALLTLVDTSASCSFFPYRFVNLAGQVEYTPEGVEIKELVGHHGDGVAIINGHFDKPKLTSAAQLHIAATDIPIDEQLYYPLFPHHQRVWDLLDPRGKTNLDIELRRAASDTGIPTPWRSIGYPWSLIPGRNLLTNSRVPTVRSLPKCSCCGSGTWPS